MKTHLKWRKVQEPIPKATNDQRCQRISQHNRRHPAKVKDASGIKRRVGVKFIVKHKYDDKSKAKAAQSIDTSEDHVIWIKNNERLGFLLVTGIDQRISSFSQLYHITRVTLAINSSCLSWFIIRRFH